MKKYLVSFLSAALLLSSLSSVALAQQNVESPQDQIAPKAIGADSGWQTKNGVRARVYTDSTFYGTGSNTISVTIEKSTSGSIPYEVYFMTDTQMVEVASGNLGTKSNHLISKSKLDPLLPLNSQGSFKVLVKLYDYSDIYPGIYGDWITNNFTAVRVN